MLPQNTVERWLCTLYMLLSGVLWTYAIGSVAAIATTLNPNQIFYETTMDQLNYFMRERLLPSRMRMALRDFFRSARRVNQLNQVRKDASCQPPPHLIPPSYPLPPPTSHLPPPSPPTDLSRPWASSITGRSATRPPDAAPAGCRRPRRQQGARVVPSTTRGIDHTWHRPHVASTTLPSQWQPGPPYSYSC